MNETTKQSCVALAQNILRSIRAQTKVANEKNIEIQIQDVTNMATPSFKSDGKGAKPRRCLREGLKGPEFKPDYKVYWLVANGAPLKSAHTFRITDVSAPEKKEKYFVVAMSATQAADYAEERRKRKIRQYKGLARLALTAAMKSLYSQSFGGSELANATALAVQTANSAAETSVTDQQNEANVHVHDKLDYAVLALKNGQASLDEAVNTAGNKMAGYLMHQAKKNWPNGNMQREQLQKIIQQTS